MPPRTLSEAAIGTTTDDHDTSRSSSASVPPTSSTTTSKRMMPLPMRANVNTQLLLAGFSVQLANVVFFSLLQVFSVHELHLSASDFASKIFGRRYSAIAFGVLFLAPLERVIGAASLLRISLVVTALATIALFLMAHDEVPVWLLGHIGAVGSLFASQAMVMVNSLIQAVFKHDIRGKATTNMHYRLLATGSAVLYPVLTTAVIVPFVPGGYRTAFVLPAIPLAVATFLLDSRLERAAGMRSDEPGPECLNQTPSEDARTTGLWRLWSALSTTVSLAFSPIREVLSTPMCWGTILWLVALNIPSHAVSTLIGNRYQELEASSRFAGTISSLAAGFGFLGIFGARQLVLRMRPLKAYAALGLVHAFVVGGMWLAGSVYSLGALNVASGMIAKSWPVIHSMCLADVTDNALLPAAFATDKVVSSSARAFASMFLSQLVTFLPIRTVFLAAGFVMLTVNAVTLLPGVGLTNLAAETEEKQQSQKKTT